MEDNEFILTIFSYIALWLLQIYRYFSIPTSFFLTKKSNERYNREFNKQETFTAQNPRNAHHIATFDPRKYFPNVLWHPLPSSCQRFGHM